MYENKCVICGKVFQGRNHQQKYCSHACTALASYRRNLLTYPLTKKKPCPVCGKLIARKATGCMKHAIRNSARGENHPLWKGGKWKTEAGYIRLSGADDRKRFEHTLVWEQTHRKPLPKGWIIHHLNGIKDDNRPENLVGMPRKNHEHNTFIKALQKRIKELEQLRLPI